MVSSMLLTIFLLMNMEVSVISDLMINEQIRDKEVRVISAEGEQLGVMSSKEAMKLAKDRLQSMGLQRAGHDSATKPQPLTDTTTWMNLWRIMLSEKKPILYTIISI